MAKKIIKAQMKQRLDTKANWAAQNPVLLAGELGIVSDAPNLYKVGDGATAWNALPFRGFDGNIVQELGDSATSVMSQKAITEQVAGQNEKLAQLDQAWNALKEQIQDAVLKVEVAPHIEVVAVSGGAAILQPDKLYDFGEVANLAIGFEAPIEGKAANYAFQFKSPADAPTTITMPDSVVFPIESDSMFNVKAGRTYQVTILNNLASASSWEV